jgi:hypothetical protein
MAVNTHHTMDTLKLGFRVKLGLLCVFSMLQYTFTRFIHRHRSHYAGHDAGHGQLRHIAVQVLWKSARRLSFSELEKA